MATATEFAAPPADDTMDMSSPEKEDIDIDIDVTDYHTSDHLGDDEPMIEDHDVRPPTATDASMDEDPPHLIEEEMHDDIPDHVTHGYEDEDELIDYEDEDEDLTVVEPVNEEPGVTPGHEGSAQPTDQALTSQQMPSDVLQEYPENEEAVEEVYRDAEDVGVEHQNNDSWAEETLVETEDAQYAAELQDANALETVGETVEQHDESHGEYESTFPNSEPHVEDEQESAIPEEQVALQRAPNPLKTRIGGVESGPPTPTDTGLHPMTLYFKGQEIPLFKSKHQANGLLKDDNLVSVSLAELIEKCKEELVSRGEEFAPVQELVLRFDRLPLMVYESSRAAFATSLNDILETFLLLHRNDGLHNPPVFFLTLTTNVAFENSLAFLKQAAESGQGASHVILPESSTLYDEEQYEYDANGNADDHEQYGDYESEHDPNSYYVDENEEYQDDEYNIPENEDPDNHNHDKVDQPEEYQDEASTEKLEETGTVETQTAQPQEVSETEANKSELSAPDNEEETANIAANPEESYNEEQPKIANINDATLENSAVSSVTAQGDEHTGECDPDIIDWDDEFLTLDGSEPTTGDYDEAFTLVETEDLEVHNADLDLSTHQGDEPVQQAVEDTKQVPEDEEPLYDQEYDEVDENELIDYEEVDEPTDTTKDQQTAEQDRNESTEVGPSPLLDEDHIDFDDDTTAEYEAKKASPSAVSNSPAGKRSFQELEDEDEIDFDEPDPKKPRS